MASRGRIRIASFAEPETVSACESAVNAPLPRSETP